MKRTLFLGELFLWYNEGMNDLKRGDHVRKIKGFKFEGTILAVYSVFDFGKTDKYAVVMLDTTEAADGLQHIYKVDQLERI